MSAVMEAREPSAKYLSTLQPPLVQHFELMATAPGGVARLRELILTLAVQGKLVRQDTQDEPASELLKKIRAEKDRLIAEGKIKRDKPLAEIATEMTPFALPESWRWVRALDICALITDGDHQPPPKADAGVPFLVIGDVRTGCADLQGASRFVPVDYFEKLDWGKKPHCGDVLYTTVGSFGIPVPIVQRQKFCFQRHIALFRPVAVELQDFLALALRTKLAYGQAERGATGIAQKTVPLSVLRDLILPLPPLAEQSRIVTRVDELMRLCDALEGKGQLEAAQHAQLLQTLLGALTASATPDELADNWQRVATHFDSLLDRPEAIDALEQTVLQMAVRGLLVPQDPNDEPASELLKKIRAEKDHLIAEGKIKRDKPLPSIVDAERSFELPQGWQCVRLDEISVVIVDCPHSTAKFVSEGLLCIDTNSFKNGVLLPHKLRYVDEATFTDRIARLQPAPGDLVFAREGSVGESLIIPEGVTACLGQRVMLFRFSENVSNEFVRLVITSKGFLDSLLALHKGIGAKHVNVGDMRLAVVPLPPLSEQRRIVARVESLRRLCADLRQRLSARQTTQAQLAEALIDEVA
jgi:type I restriction enzyme, S subunit